MKTGHLDLRPVARKPAHMGSLQSNVDTTAILALVPIIEQMIAVRFARLDLLAV